MSIPYTQFIGFTDTISGKTFISPQTTGNFYLRRHPFTSNTYTGSHIGDGVWDFGTIEDGLYQVWNASSQLIKYATKYIGDKEPVFDSLNVLGDVSVTGQVNFRDSFNMNGADLAHADNIQVNSLSENSAGGGVSFAHKIVLSDAVRIASNLVCLSGNNTFSAGRNMFTFISPEYTGSNSISLSGLVPRYYADANYGRLASTNNWSSQNIYNSFAPQCSIAPTVGSHLTNKTYVDTSISNAVLSANLSSFTSALINQVSANVVRLLPNGTNSTTNRVATSWALAMKQAKQSITSSGSSATIQQIIYIEGIGQSGTSLPISDTEIGTYFYPKVHVKGISQSVKLLIPDAPMISGGTALGCIIEDLTIYHDDGGFGATPTFSDMTFKDCYFDMKVDSLTFSNCVFRGTNIINMKTGNLYLNSITGTSYYSSVIANKTGTNPTEIVSSNI